MLAANLCLRLALSSEPYQIEIPSDTEPQLDHSPAARVLFWTEPAETVLLSFVLHPDERTMSHLISHRLPHQKSRGDNRPSTEATTAVLANWINFFFGGISCASPRQASSASSRIAHPHPTQMLVSSLSANNCAYWCLSDKSRRWFCTLDSCVGQKGKDNSPNDQRTLRASAMAS